MGKKNVSGHPRGGPESLRITSKTGLTPIWTLPEVVHQWSGQNMFHWRRKKENLFLFIVMVPTKSLQETWTGNISLKAQRRKGFYLVSEGASRESHETDILNRHTGGEPAELRVGRDDKKHDNFRQTCREADAKGTEGMFAQRAVKFGTHIEGNNYILDKLKLITASCHRSESCGLRNSPSRPREESCLRVQEGTARFMVFLHSTWTPVVESDQAFPGGLWSSKSELDQAFPGGSWSSRVTFRFLDKCHSFMRCCLLFFFFHLVIHTPWKPLLLCAGCAARHWRYRGRKCPLTFKELMTLSRRYTRTLITDQVANEWQEQGLPKHKGEVTNPV